ncbi:MAG: tRNA (guanosine(46)-N7)-methyltransferase TrmB [Treponema sp.]|nr:tRNA (guanosine(46)-N7)-methyltransferase TrmB [Treponema sp.]MCL2230162.1 tRNA (guanosine(46)-N7)-methyltransferase TrmB [Treponema sp.]
MQRIYGCGADKLMLKSYVLRQGRYTQAQKNAYENLSQNILIPFSEETKIDIGNLTVEIGFGSGFATAEIAQANPDRNYLGIEVHKPGIGRLLWEMEKRNLDNIKIIEYDAVLVFENMIQNCSLEAVHVFFPDPWPKKRHHKRRLVQRPFTDLLCKSLKKGGYIYFVTDWEEYALFALEELSATEGIKNEYDRFSPPQNWRPNTRFEQKGIAKEHVIRELFFRKT